MNRRFALNFGLFVVGATVLSACTPAGPVAGGTDVVDVIAANSDFSTFIAAAAAADIITPMKQRGPFTVFVPTNAAFADLPDGVLAELLLPENKQQLFAVLTYHVVPGSVTVEQLTGQRLGVGTINGASLQIDGRNGVKVKTADIVSPDIPASNGVVHAIDTVLFP